jgi:MtN3 and saliva related transmembrane protein
MQLAELVGLLAAVGTTGAFLPQVVKSWKTRSTKDFSWLMLALYVIGVFLWLVYGLMIGQVPVIAANAVTEVLILCIVAAKLKYG